MKRMGRRNRAFWRVCVADQRAPRDGKVIEQIGHYDPHEASPERQIVINAERASYWLGTGAQPSDRVAQFFRKLGITR